MLTTYPVHKHKDDPPFPSGKKNSVWMKKKKIKKNIFRDHKKMLNPSAWANEPEIFVKVTGGFVNVMSRAMGANKEF